MKLEVLTVVHRKSLLRLIHLSISVLPHTASQFEKIITPSHLTSEQELEVAEFKERRSRFHFANYDIPVGAKLLFTRDANISVEVLDGDKILAAGETGSLSSVATKLLGYKNNVPRHVVF